jgi:tetratricopeptide (TPR) repeat protein
MGNPHSDKVGVSSPTASAMTDFFVSYTQADRAWAEWIAWVLEAAGFTTKIQAWDFGAGSNFIIEMHKAADEAVRTIAVLSPEYLGSDFGQMEWAAALAQKKELLPVRIHEVEPGGVLAAIGFVDLVGLAGEAARSALLTAAKKERPKPLTEPPFPGEVPGEEPPFPLGITDLPETKLPDVGPLPRGSRMPFSRNPLFVGREEDLRTLARQLRAGETSAVGQVEIAAASGLGGIGKTQLASEFVHRYGRYFPGGVFWMSFADPAAVPAEVAACGRNLDLHPSYDALPLDQQVRLMEKIWMREIPRLLVFDNCEDEALLDRWRPRSGGARVLVTSRRPRWARSLGVRPVPLTTLPRAVSIELLRRFRSDVPDEEPALSGIAAELGDLPLALHLAGSFLERYAEEPGGQPAAYLEALRQGGLLRHPSLQGRLAGLSPTSHEAHVGRTFALSLEKLKPEDETEALALALLARAAHFAPGESIPRGLLLKTVDMDGDDPGARLRAADALERLLALGLLEAGKAGGLVMHRLVAELARTSGDGEEARNAVEDGLYAEAARLNRAGFPEPLLAWQPHLRAVVERALPRDDERAASLCNELGYHLWMIGDYPGARPYYERALAIREKVLGPEHPDTAYSLNNLGFLLQSQGDLAGARPYCERALAIFEARLGPEHPNTKIARRNLASLGASPAGPSPG